MTTNPFLLRVIPPRHATVTPTSQVEMFAALARVRGTLAGGVALEIAGEAGRVQFLARAANAAIRERLEALVSGYYPQGAIVRLEDPTDDPAGLRAGEAAQAAELRLRTRAELPLRTLARDETSAQLLRVIGVLRTLPTGMRGVCQLILWPTPRHWGRDVERWLQHQRALMARRPPDDTGLPAGLVAGLVAVALAAWATYHAYQVHDTARLIGIGAAILGVGALLIARLILFAPDPPPDPALVERKLATPAFTARLRLVIIGGREEDRRHAVEALIGAYHGYDEPRGNGFVARPCAPDHVAAITTGGGPRFWRRPWPILSAAEVAGLYHVPVADVEVPGLARTGARVLLPATPALASGTPIGTATLGRHSDVVCIPRAAHASNTVVLGATGTGKSTFLQHYAHNAVARDDVQLVVIDPDSTLVQDMVGWLPDAQKLRAAVLDFGQPTYAVGLNLLDAYTGRRTDQIVDSLVQAWARYYAEAWGPRLEDLIRYACATLLAANRTRPRERQLTLLDVKPLLQVSAFRDAVVREADDVKLSAYWRDDYLGMPRTERLTAIKPVLTRVNRFLLNDAAHAVVGQSESTINVPRLLETGAPLFIDAAAHTIGAETAALLDAVLLNVIHDAVCERRSRERQVLIVVDEFQHTPALWDEYLPRIRKFGGSYVLAAQGIASIDRVQRDLHTVIVGNTATHVIFRSPDPDEATYLAAVLDNAVTAEDVQTLGLRQCYIKTSDADGPLPVVAATLPPPPPSSGGTARLIAAACARRYGRPVADVLAARTRWMAELFYTSHTEPERGAARTERRRGAAPGYDDASGADAAPPDQRTGPATIGEERPAPSSLGPGSQPILGLPVTRASLADTVPPRRKRRRRRLSAPSQTLFDLAAPVAAAAGSDPLPVPGAPEPAARQLPLLPDRDEA